MFGISSLELGVIAIVALLVIGPERLPELAAKIGRITGALRRQTDGIRREFQQSVYPPMEPPPRRLVSRSAPPPVATAPAAPPVVDASPPAAEIVKKEGEPSS